MGSSSEVYGCQGNGSGAGVTIFTQSAEETKMVRFEGEFQAESQSPGDLEARSATSEVTGKTKRDGSYLRNFRREEGVCCCGI